MVLTKGSFIKKLDLDGGRRNGSCDLVQIFSAHIEVKMNQLSNETG